MSAMPGTAGARDVWKPGLSVPKLISLPAILICRKFWNWPWTTDSISGPANRSVWKPGQLQIIGPMRNCLQPIKHRYNILCGSNWPVTISSNAYLWNICRYLSCLYWSKIVSGTEKIICVVAPVTTVAMCKGWAWVALRICWPLYAIMCMIKRPSRWRLWRKLWRTISKGSKSCSISWCIILRNTVTMMIMPTSRRYRCSTCTMMFCRDINLPGGRTIG